MKKGLLKLIIIGSMVSFCCFDVSAADIHKSIDEFYLGLAIIVERNMDAPQACVQAVNLYYQENQSSIQKIRTSAEEVLQKSAPLMEKMMNNYMKMSEEELAALEQQQKGSMMKTSQHTLPGTDRYTNALQNFTKKYPQYGMQIAMKAMELVPGYNSNK